MTKVLNRLEVYSLYFYEYFRYGEWLCLLNSIYFMATRKSLFKGGLVKTSMGKFETRPHTLDFQYINYAYELGIKKFINKEKFDVFIDAGACIGEYSVWLASKGKKCFTFEPVTSSYDVIIRNVKLNGLDKNINVFNYGLGKQHEISYFKINPINFGASKRVNQEVEGAQKFEINAFDDIYEGLQIPSDARIIFKIDVEGMEPELMLGAKAFIAKYPNLLFIVEEKLSGEERIRKILDNICAFEYGVVDEYNFYARKK